MQSPLSGSSWLADHTVDVCSCVGLQDGQNHLWRLQHQKSFDRISVGAEVPHGHGSWLASSAGTHSPTVKEHLQQSMHGGRDANAAANGLIRRTSGSRGSLNNIVVDLRRSE